MSETMRRYGNVSRQVTLFRALDERVLHDQSPATDEPNVNLANGVLWEVVVQQEPALNFTLLKIIHELLVFFGAKRVETSA